MCLSLRDQNTGEQQNSYDNEETMSGNVVSSKNDISMKKTKTNGKSEKRKVYGSEEQKIEVENSKNRKQKSTYLKQMAHATAQPRAHCFLY